MLIRLVIFVVAVSFSGGSYAGDSDRFIKQLTFQTGQTLLIAEGEREARSIGSFSVRLYDAGAKGDETTFFLDGLIMARDGAIETATLADINGDQLSELIVISRTVGSGSYLSAYAFSIADNRLESIHELNGMQPDTDPVNALRKACCR
ncbi:hypothetical protein A3760_30600 [Oleiphilus sp. HI0122]|nr:hypothetical protein A3760_30600 [Oleiphilus sp. HI0122]